MLASKALEPCTPRWPFARRVRDHIAECSPRGFAESVRTLIESLVTAYKEDSPHASSFSASEPFRQALSFLPLATDLATHEDIHLETANFALPTVRPDENWPPQPGSTLHPVYVHAQSQLRWREMQAEARLTGSRSTVPLPPLPVLAPPFALTPLPTQRLTPLTPLTPPPPPPLSRRTQALPIPLSSEPCISMLLHPGRLRTGSEIAQLRVALVSMLVVDDLPDEIQICLRLRSERGGGGGGGGGDGDGGGGDSGRSDGGSSRRLVVTFRRDEFDQQGPSGPIECKKILQLQVPALEVRRATPGAWRSPLPDRPRRSPFLRPRSHTHTYLAT